MKTKQNTIVLLPRQFTIEELEGLQRKSGLNQAQFAALLGLTANKYAKTIAGSARISLLLCRLLEVMESRADEGVKRAEQLAIIENNLLGVRNGADWGLWLQRCFVFPRKPGLDRG